MEYIAKILDSLKGLNWFIISLIFISSMAWLFRDSIDELLVPEIELIDKINEDAVVNEALKELLNLAGADRAYVFQFHNGTTYFDGSHQNKFSMTYEIVKKGIDPTADVSQNLQVSLFSGLLNEIIDGEMHYHDINNVKDLRARLMFKNQGIKSISVAPYYRNNKLVAIIGVDFVRISANNDEILYNTVTPKWDSDTIWSLFMASTNQIGDLL